jgi:hypothetical protein
VEGPVNYANKIKMHFNLLMRSIDPTDILIDSLSIRSILSKSDIEAISSRSTPDARNSHLLRTLQNLSKSVIEEVISVFKDLKQEHVARLISGDSSIAKLPMSDDNYNILGDKLNELRKCLNPVGGLLEELISTRTIQQNDQDRILSKKTMDEKAVELVKILQRKCNDAFADFFSALRKTNQMHVMYILTFPHEGEPPMTDYHLTILQEQSDMLMENILVTATSLLSHLFKQGVFSRFDGQWVRAAGTPNESVQRLMEILERKPDSAFDKFISSLRNSDHGHVAEALENTVHGSVEFQHEDNMSEERKQAVSKITVDTINAPNGFRQTLKHDGIIPEASLGSIVIHFSCLTVQSLQSLENRYSSGKLQDLFWNCFDHLLSEQGVSSFVMKISDAEFEKARNNFKKSPLLTAQHRLALKHAVDSLLDDINVTDELLNLLPLDRLRKQYVAQEKEPRRKAANLLDVLSRLPDRVFMTFVDVLKTTGQHRIADVIEKSAAGETEEDGYSKRQMWTSEYPGTGVKDSCLSYEGGDDNDKGNSQKVSLMKT